MADVVLLLDRQLGQGPSTDDEDRVVTEASAATGLATDGSLEDSFCGQLFSLGSCQRDNCSECRTSVCSISEVGEEFGDVVGVRGIRSRIASRVHAGGSIESDDLEPGVIAQRGEPGGSRHDTRLEQSITLQSELGFLDLGPLEATNDLNASAQTAEHGFDFGHFVRILGSNDQAVDDQDAVAFA